MKNKKILCVSYVLFFVTSCVCPKSGNQAEWTILTYMQADNNLAPFAAYNIRDMQKAGYKKGINVLVQWIKPASKTVGRHVLGSDGKIKEELVLPSEKTLCPKEAIISAFRWAKRKYPARHYMLILWNHGAGIIDHETYPYHKNVFVPCFSWLRVPGLAYSQKRGILYSDTTQTYMDNQQLAETLKIIKDKILYRKLDILGMDACFMAMLEVGYQVKEYAHYMVASQNSEPGQGWNYRDFLEKLGKDHFSLTPLSFARQIVFSYRRLYHDKRFSFYTQSLLDLTKMDMLKKDLDKVVQCLLACKRYRHAKITNMIKRARYMSVHFDVQAFIDLFSFYKSMHKLSKQSSKKINNSKYASFQETLKDLNKSLKKAMANLKTAIKANVAGNVFKKARGLSVYFPQKIHSSYQKTSFAQESKWMSLFQGVTKKVKKEKR